MKWTYCIISSLLFSIPTIGHTQRNFTVTVVPEQSIEKSKLECKLIAAETEEDLRYTADSTQLIGQGSTKGGYVFLEISYQIKDRNYSKNIVGFRLATTSWPVIWDPEQKIGKRFHLTSIPLTVLVDKDSKIRIIGSLHELEQEIERINLREQSTY